MSCSRSVTGLPCLEHTNPRRAGFCFRCDFPMPAQLKRDREFERTAAVELTRGLNLDVSRLVAMAQHRADRGAETYGRDFPDLSRDLPREVEEEISDGVIYVLWWLDAIRRELLDGGDRVEHLQAAVKYGALMFNEIEMARE